MPPRDIRTTRAWRRARARVLANATTCAICGGRLDFDAPPRTTWAPSVDHITALNSGGDALSRGNLAAAHFGCNSSKQDAPPLRVVTSRPI